MAVRIQARRGFPSVLTPPLRRVTSSLVTVKAPNTTARHFGGAAAHKSRQPDACQNQLYLSKTPANTLAGVTLVMPPLPFALTFKTPSVRRVCVVVKLFLQVSSLHMRKDDRTQEWRQTLIAATGQALWNLSIGQGSRDFILK